jgi:hypothetical protein
VSTPEQPVNQANFAQAVAKPEKSVASGQPPAAQEHPVGSARIARRVQLATTCKRAEGTIAIEQPLPWQMASSS